MDQMAIFHYQGPIGVLMDLAGREAAGYVNEV